LTAEPLWLLSLLAGLFGLLIGSFLNVCVYRLPRDLSVVSPRSFCTECGGQISWFDNIPVLSYLLLRGRCRQCHQRIPLRYPLVEILTAILFAIVTVRYGATLASCKWCLFEALLVALFFTDLEERILPDEFTIGGGVAGLIFAFFVHVPGFFSEIFLTHSPLWVQSLFEAGLAAVIMTVPIWLLSILWGRLRQREVLGMGDLKLLPMLGVFLGLDQGISALLIGSISGVVIGGGYIYLSKQKASTYELPLGSFFCLGAALIPLLVRL
jgi:leader peptidase (prepilin peptidase) / N-methyltransferase